MAIDNLNFYSNGLPAGQLTDKYSSQPGCLKSKNLDIFSSSKSVKATAWSTPVAIDSDIIKQSGKLKLKTDGKVYEETANGDVLVIDPSTDFPVRQVCYTGKNGTYANAQWGTPKDLIVKNIGDDWQAFAVYTDRSAYYYNKDYTVLDKSLNNARKYWEWDEDLTRGTDDYIWITQNGSGGAPNSAWIRLTVSGHDEFNFVPVRLKCDWGNTTLKINSGDTWISETSINDSAPSRKVRKYYYDPELDAMTPEDDETDLNDLVTTSGTLEGGLLIYLPVLSEDVTWTFYLKDSVNTHSGGSFGIDFNYPSSWSPNNDLKDGDFRDYYAYLPLDEDREFKQIGEYYWLPAQTFQTLYNWEGTRTDTNGVKKLTYSFQQYMGWANPTEMDVIGMISWNEAIYMLGNMDGNGYIFPCDLAGGRGTPYIASGCEFLGATNIDYLMYLVGTDRGISQLWVFNQQELVPIVGGKEENDTTNLIDTTEQYRFDGRMVEYRGDLLLTTADNRIFRYGQTFGGKGGSFIHELPGTVTNIRAEGNDLIVEYSVTAGGTTTKYTTTYLDDKPVKVYNTEWMAEYPIVLGNHLLEKEESDLYASYILPSSACKLEFWGMANHYHFWTFKVSGTYTINPGSNRYIDGSDGNYKLEFLEANGEYLTFKLSGDLPVMTGSETRRIREYLVPAGQSFTYIPYTEYNHFRKIGEITTGGYQEGEFRFHNLNNKLELPRSYSLQIMVRGKGTVNYTPELFAVDLVANQRERG